MVRPEHRIELSDLGFVGAGRGLYGQVRENRRRIHRFRHRRQTTQIPIDWVLGRNTIPLRQPTPFAANDWISQFDEPLGLAQRLFTPRVLHMYSMVMMMAVASSGDAASFGGRNGCDGGGCNGRVGLFAKHNSCDGGGCSGREGLIAKWKARKGSCCGEAAPACCPAPVACPAPCPAPAPVACPAPCPTPCADPCDPCAKKKLFAGLFHRKKKDCCEPACPTTCNTGCATSACAAPGAPVAAPAAAPKTMPKAEAPAPKKES